jgi:D-alanyl-D-alanine-carboxypeptidase/D-alanyl-D-alanine-endopeptidase
MVSGFFTYAHQPLSGSGSLLNLNVDAMLNKSWVFAGLSLGLLPWLAIAQPLSTAQLADQYALRIFQDSKPVGMSMVVINGGEALQRFHGRVRPGSKQQPDGNSLLRIASLTKLMTSEVLVAQALHNKVGLNDPLLKYAPPGWQPATAANGQPITLLDLATHTSGLPREMPGNKAPDTPVFVWPDQRQRWQWLSHRKATAPVGRAAYSNLAYDYLADALSRAARQPYERLLQQQVVQPLGMRDTTLKPTAAQCARLLAGFDPSPCTETTAAGGSGGVYSTANDMQRWLQNQLTPRSNADRLQVAQSHRMVFQRSALNSVKGLDVVGTADAVGLGWIYMKPQPGRPAMLQKTGGGGGFLSYIAMLPGQNVGVFVSITYTGQTSFRSMSNAVHQLLAKLDQRKLG